MGALRLEPEIVMRKGKAEAVILKMDDYAELLERLEDAEDMKWLRMARKKPLRFRPLDEFLEEVPARV